MLSSRAAETAVTLDDYISDLNLEISPDRYSCQSMHKDGFAYMWAGAKATSGVRRGKVCYEVKIVENLQVTTSEFTDAHIVRVGWSSDAATLQLGEDKNSFGYGGTAKKSEGRNFSDYGRRFDAGDVIGCYLSIGGGWVDISFCVNGYQCGTAFKVRWNSDEALYPHVLTKNCRLEVNFGQAHNPYFSILPGYKFIGNTPPESRVFGAKAPSTKRECEIIMMVGLPGVGKTTWAMNYAKLHSNKKYNILGTDAIIDKMRVQGLPRKDNFGGRWDVLIKQATECFNAMLRKASSLNRNLILDQTNVYASARKRKARQYKDVGYTVHAMVLVPTDDEMISRSKHRTATEGKEVPEAAINDMKANFSLPHENENLFTTITFLELQRTDAENLVMQYNIDAGLKGYRSNKQARQGVNENQKEKSEKLQFDDSHTQPPARSRSPNGLKGKVDGEWDRGDGANTWRPNPGYPPYDQYGVPQRRADSTSENMQPPHPIERRDNDGNPRDTNQWAPYEKKNFEPSWQNDLDDRNKYSSRTDSSMEFRGNESHTGYSQPPSKRGEGQQREPRNQRTFEMDMEPRYMGRFETSKPGMMSGTDTPRRMNESVSNPDPPGYFGQASSFGKTNDRPSDNLKPPWQSASSNLPYQPNITEDSPRIAWNETKPIQPKLNQPPPSHRDPGDFHDHRMAEQWEQRPPYVDPNRHSDIRRSEECWAGFDDSPNPKSDFEDWRGPKNPYKVNPAPNEEFRPFPPQIDNVSQDRLQQFNNQHYPDREFQKQEFEPQEHFRNTLKSNTEQSMRYDGPERRPPVATHQRGRILDSIPTSLAGVDFDDLRATLANVRQQALHGKNSMGEREQLTEPPYHNQMIMDQQNRMPELPMKNHPNDIYQNRSDEGYGAGNRPAETGRDNRRVPDNYQRIPGETHTRAPPLLQDPNHNMQFDASCRNRNDRYDRQMDSNLPVESRSDVKYLPDRKGAVDDRHSARVERRTSNRGPTNESSSNASRFSRDRRRSSERSSQSRTSDSRSQRTSREVNRDREDHRRRRTPPKRHFDKRNEGSTKERDDFGRDPKQRRYTRSPQRAHRDGRDSRAEKDVKSAPIDESKSRYPNNRDRDRSSNSSRHEIRSPEVKLHSGDTRSKSSTWERRENNEAKKPLLQLPESFQDPTVSHPIENKFAKETTSKLEHKMYKSSSEQQRRPSHDKKPLLSLPPTDKNSEITRVSTAKSDSMAPPRLVPGRSDSNATPRNAPGRSDSSVSLRNEFGRSDNSAPPRITPGRSGGDVPFRDERSEGRLHRNASGRPDRSVSPRQVPGRSENNGPPRNASSKSGSNALHRNSLERAKSDVPPRNAPARSDTRVKPRHPPGRSDNKVPPRDIPEFSQAGKEYVRGPGYGKSNEEENWVEGSSAANHRMPHDGLLGPRPTPPKNMANASKRPFEKQLPSVMAPRPPLLETPVHRFDDHEMPPRQGLPRPQFLQGNGPPRHGGMRPPRHEGVRPPRHVGMRPPRHEGLRPSRHEGLRPPRHEGMRPLRHENMGMMPEMHRPRFQPPGEFMQRPFNHNDPRFGSIQEPRMGTGRNPMFPTPRHVMTDGPRPLMPDQPWRMPRVPRPGPPRSVRM